MLSNKAKSTVKVALIYFATIFILLVLLGFIAYMILTKVIFPNEEISFNKPAALDYQPTSSDASTILFVGDDEKKLNVLMLVRIEPVHLEITCISVPVETIAKVNTKEGTLKSFYEKGGIEALRPAVESAFGIPIERYMVMNKDSFGRLVKSLGGVSYSLPSDLFYYNRASGEITDFKAGDKSAVFTGEDLVKIMTYPSYPKGLEYNINISGGIIRSLINNTAKSKDVLTAHIDEIYYGFAGQTQSNITDVDYNVAKKAILYIVSKNDNPADYYVPDGARRSDGGYVLDSGYKDKIRKLFHIEQPPA